MKKQSLISAFDSILGPPIDEEIEEGFFSVEQIAKRSNRSPITMQQRLYAMFKAGKVERRMFRNSNRCVCWFYRVK